MTPRQRQIKELMVQYGWSYAQVLQTLHAEHRAPLMAEAERNRGNYQVIYKVIRRVERSAFSKAQAEMRQTRRSRWYKLWLAGRLRWLAKVDQTDHSPLIT